MGELQGCNSEPTARELQQHRPSSSECPTMEQCVRAVRRPPPQGILRASPKQLSQPEEASAAVQQLAGAARRQQRRPMELAALAEVGVASKCSSQGVNDRITKVYGPF